MLFPSKRIRVFGTGKLPKRLLTFPGYLVSPTKPTVGTEGFAIGVISSFKSNSPFGVEIDFSFLDS
jgi:hypothetical protein